MKTKTIVARAHAKVNLCLEILGKRPDGYHQLATVMQAIGLWDTLTISIRDAAASARINLHTEGWPVPRHGENLCCRAARTFLDAVGQDWQVEICIRLLKRIPPGGGLGGGSSNAAAVLTALNVATGCPLDEEELLELGAHIGSDVPFFLSSASTALATGRGEQIRPLRSVAGIWFVVAWPGEPVSTRWAYSQISGDDFSDGSFTNSLEEAIAEEKDILSAPELGYNAFFRPVTRARADIGRLVELLKSIGARQVGLAGSGACVWGAVANIDVATQIADELSRRRLWAQVAAPAPRPVEIIDPFITAEA